jgi:hypothetical protein
MKKESFVGVWKLVSFELESSDGEITYPYGKEAKGYIMYHDNGFMSVGIMSNGRKDFDSNDILGGSSEEKSAAINTYLTYCGTYSVTEKTVVHNAEISLFPNWTNSGLERFYKFEDDKLILSTDLFLIDGKKQMGVVIWEKV